MDKTILVIVRNNTIIYEDNTYKSHIHDDGVPLSEWKIEGEYFYYKHLNSIDFSTDGARSDLYLAVTAAIERKLSEEVEKLILS